jgi:hypothetical protein
MDFSLNNYFLMFQKEKEAINIVTLTDLSKIEIKISELSLP